MECTAACGKAAEVKGRAAGGKGILSPQLMAQYS